VFAKGSKQYGARKPLMAFACMSVRRPGESEKTFKYTDGRKKAWANKIWYF